MCRPVSILSMQFGFIDDKFGLLCFVFNENICLKHNGATRISFGDLQTYRLWNIYTVELFSGCVLNHSVHDLRFASK